MVINFIMSENKRCDIGEVSVMDGKLSCSNRSTASILNATQSYFENKIKNPVDSSNPGICVSTNSWGNTYNYGSNNSVGVLNLHLIDATGTIRLGTCVNQPCSGPYPYNGNKVGYIDSEGILKGWIYIYLIKRAIISAKIIDLNVCRSFEGLLLSELITD